MPSMLNTFLPVFQDTVLKFDTTALLVCKRPEQVFILCSLFPSLVPSNTYYYHLCGFFMPRRGKNVTLTRYPPVDWRFCWMVRSDTGL